ncbi:uncharacterized protein LOC113324142 [Papaver somniferum]|uniref:uncharacterized protein LOC113324142 n=1 Tax=Papaver somniferum TaxID=3469 RepID=UPI000E6FC232|nr:uncharacterized protein LOC113324142 [Papaver somniferum]
MSTSAGSGNFCSLPFTNITNFVSMKFDGSNYLLWRDQFEGVLISTDLFGYVNGELVEPPRNITVNGVETINQEWVSWRNFRTQYLAIKNMLRAQLHGIKKGNQSVVVYLQNIKTITDSFAAIGAKVSNEDLMMFVMNGLSSDYDVFVISSQNRETPYTFGELKEKLLSHEQFLDERQHQHQNVYDEQNTIAMYARNNSNGSHLNGRN